MFVALALGFFAPARASRFFPGVFWDPFAPVFVVWVWTPLPPPLALGLLTVLVGGFGFGGGSKSSLISSNK